MNKGGVAVIGAGSWGTALAVLLGEKGYNLMLWVRNEAAMDDMAKSRQNSRYLPGVKLPGNVVLSNDIRKVVTQSEMIILAVPSHLVRMICRTISPWIRKDHVLINTAKGIENGSYMRMSQVIQDEIPNVHVAVLSGPSHAEEVSRGIPTTVVASSDEYALAEKVQELFITPKFRVYTNLDLTGVEMGGALKNIIALGAGISDGLGFGDNTKAALMTRGIVEIARLGKAMGAQPLTFAGLSGVGDLIVTCTNVHSRNRKAGIEIGKGRDIQQVLASIGMVVEGIKTCQAAYHLSQRMNIEMPIASQIYEVLYEKKNPREAVEDLMLRDRTHEGETDSLGMPL